MDSTRKTISVLVVGDGGVGKSWLINRLVRYLNGDEKDYINEEMDKLIQTFVEYPPPGQHTITLEQSQIPQTCEVVANGITITLKEAYGLHSIIDYPLQEQIKTIARDSQTMNLCVYVARYDHQLAGENSTQLQDLSAQIGSKKLIIFLGRKYILRKDKQIEGTKQVYNKQKGLFRELVDNNIQHLAQLIIGSSTSFNSQSSMVQEPPSYQEQLDHNQQYSIHQKQITDDHQEKVPWIYLKKKQFPKEIVENLKKIFQVFADNDKGKKQNYPSKFNLLLVNAKELQKSKDRVLNDELFIKKGILCFDQDSKLNNIDFIQNHPQVQYMRGLVMETIYIQLKNQEVLSVEQCRGMLK